MSGAAEICGISVQRMSQLVLMNLIPAVQTPAGKIINREDAQAYKPRPAGRPSTRPSAVAAAANGRTA